VGSWRERIERGRIAGRGRGVELGRSDPHADGGEIDAVEFLGQFKEGRVAARRHIGNDRAHRLLDIGRSLALGIQKGAETDRKINGTGVEADRQAGGPGGPAARMTAQWLAGKCPSSSDLQTQT
jgi:hypothetical protein